MVESIAATSLFGYRPVSCNSCCKNVPNKRKLTYFYRISYNEFLGKEVSSSVCLRVDQPMKSWLKAQAMELTKEAYFNRDREQISRSFRFGIDTRTGLWPPENKADNPELGNPLLRLERMGCGWFGAIFEWEGVLVEDNPELEKQAWLALSQEEGKSPPPAFMLKRVHGIKNEQAISEVLCWSRDPVQVKRMGSRKEEIYQSFHGGIYRFRSGSQEFVNVMMNYKIPMALVSTRPRKYIDSAIRSIGIEGIFTVIVTAEDVYRGKPDPEMFLYAAQLLQFIPERCIIFGNSNLTVEVAHDAHMKCVAVASNHPVYELGAADLVVRHLDELSIVDLKNLAAVESEPELELEIEEESKHHRPSSVVDDSFW